MNVVKFKYYDDFHCNGPECRDMCCRYWRVNISKREYLDFKKLKCSPELRDIIDKTFIREKGVNADESHYATIKFDENGRCPLLGKDSLCMMQKELGEDTLGMVCAIYPRLRTFVGHDVLLESCDATCFHVTELLMSHPEGLEIVEEENVEKDKFIKNYRRTNAITPQEKEFLFFWDILNAQIDILQDRSFTISERLLILGYFCSKADEYIKNNAASKIPGLAQTLMDKGLCQKIADSLKAPNSEERAKETVNILAINRKEFTPFYTTLTEKLRSDVLKRLEISGGSPENGTISFNFDEYRNLCETFHRLDEERPYITENLLVNLLFAYNPLKGGVWDHYFDMVIFYNLLRVCAPVFLPENYSDSDLALALTYSEKLIINSFLAHGSAVCDFMLKKRYTLPHAALLIC